MDPIGMRSAAQAIEMVAQRVHAGRPAVAFVPALHLRRVDHATMAAAALDGEVETFPHDIGRVSILRLAPIGA
jgi:hypothetical protein